MRLLAFDYFTQPLLPGRFVVVQALIALRLPLGLGLRQRLGWRNRFGIRRIKRGTASRFAPWRRALGRRRVWIIALEHRSVLTKMDLKIAAFAPKLNLVSHSPLPGFAVDIRYFVLPAILHGLLLNGLRKILPLCPYRLSD
jgi:hypothetical protein